MNQAYREHIRALRKRRLEEVAARQKMLASQDVKKLGFIINRNGKHISGKMWSDKNQSEIAFRSAYEFAYCLRLEEDSNVKAYFMEAMSIPYKLDGVLHKYIPDLFVVYEDGRSEVIEIKPSSMVRRQDVQAKAIAANKFISASGVKNCSYRFVTEEEIFDSYSQYKKFIGALKQ